MNRDKFLDLLRIDSRGGSNKGIHEYIKAELDAINVPYSVFKDTTIYCINKPGLPLFSAHTDTVRREADDNAAKTNITARTVDAKSTESGEPIELTVINNPGFILGGDDMCGVHIILEMLREGKELNFVFSDGEETMNGTIIPFVRIFANELSKLPYAIVLDRKGDTDIICSHNHYGSKKFEDSLGVIGAEFGYYPEIGMCSDADYIRNVLSCANLGIGYYKAHSNKEFVVWEHMQKSHDYASAILEVLHDKFEVHPSVFTSYFEGALLENTIDIIRASGVLGFRI